MTSLKIVYDYLNLNSKKNSNNIDFISYKCFLHVFFNPTLHYSEFTIPKKNGSERKILAPDRKLKIIQYSILSILESLFKPNAAIHGFCKTKSIQSNAIHHVNCIDLLNVDIEDYFPSINTSRISSVLQLTPFSFDKNFASALAKLCTLNGSLPQGAPTSPIVSNIICQRLDRKLKNFAKTHKLYYTRYADDITFSSKFRKINRNLITLLNNIVVTEGLKLNSDKTRISSKHQSQIVTGIVINEKLNVNRKKIREVRAMIHNFAVNYSSNQKLINEYNATSIINKIKGNLSFISNTRGANDSLSIKYANKFYNALNYEHKS